jgi:L-alanine-DL-glutamate epimerase-like enolase superfamily enzyme
VSNSVWLEYIPQLDAVARSTLRIADGHAVPSSEPGLGIDWDWDRIGRLTVAGSLADLGA